MIANQKSNKMLCIYVAIGKTKKEVKEIYLSNLGCTILSKKYNVSKTNIRYIKTKKQWKWLTDTLD